MRRWLLMAIWLCVSAGSHAAYITDQLVAGLHPGPELSESPIEALPSGTTLQLLEEQPGWARVQLLDGREGWVERRFLTEDKPAKVQLLEIQSQQRTLQSELALSQKQLLEAQQRLAQLSPAAADSAGGPDRAMEHQPAGGNPGLTGDLPWSIWSGLVLLALALGVLFGKSWEDRKQRRRHGGFRI